MHFLYHYQRLAKVLPWRRLTVAAGFAIASLSLNLGSVRAVELGASQAVASGHATSTAITLTNPQLVTPTVYDQMPTQNLSAAERVAFGAAQMRSHRSGPLGLPSARQIAPSKDPGPGLSPTVAPNASTDFVSAQLTLPAATAGGFSAVTEPSGDDAGQYRFHTGNWFAAFSVNRGVNWSYLNPFTIFGSGFCCDQVAIYDTGRNAWFWLLQYTDGSLRLAVSTNNLASWCAYTITPATTGFTGEIDYNDLALGTNFIYVVSNIFPAAGGQGSQVIRMPLDSLTTCGAWSGNYFRSETLGFTWKPVAGANDAMYWGTNWFGTLGSSFRVFKWQENSSGLAWFDRTLGTTFSFFTRNSGQNCAGTGGVVQNWCQFADSRVLGGARYQAVDGQSYVVFSFNAGQGGPFSLPNPYTERAYFRESDLNYVASDRLFGSTTAFQFMSMATDARGHIGMTAMWGGGSSNFYPGGIVVLQDDVSPNQPWASVFHSFGSGNPCTQGGLYRTGDYTTTRPFRPADKSFMGYNFNFSANAGDCGSFAPMRVNAVRFGRSRDLPGIARWN